LVAAAVVQDPTCSPLRCAAPNKDPSSVFSLPFQTETIALWLSTDLYNMKHQQYYNSRSTSVSLILQIELLVDYITWFIYEILSLLSDAHYMVRCVNLLTYELLVLLLWIKLAQSCMIIVFNFIKIRYVQSYTCNLVKFICNIVSFVLLSYRKYFYLVTRSEFDYITDSLYGTHARTVSHHRLSDFGLGCHQYSSVSLY